MPDCYFSAAVCSQRLLFRSQRGGKRKGMAVAGQPHPEGLSGGLQKSQNPVGLPEFLLLCNRGNHHQYRGDGSLCLPAFQKGICGKKRDFRPCGFYYVFQRRPDSHISSCKKSGAAEYQMGASSARGPQPVEHGAVQDLYGKFHTG